MQFCVVSCIQVKCTSNGQKSLSHTYADRVEAKMNNLLNFSSANYASIDYGVLWGNVRRRTQPSRLRRKHNSQTHSLRFIYSMHHRSFIRSPDYALLSVNACLHVAIAKTDTKCKRQWKTNMLQIPKRVWNGEAMLNLHAKHINRIYWYISFWTLNIKACRCKQSKWQYQIQRHLFTQTDFRSQ